MQGKYIYGVIKTNQPESFGRIGIGNPLSEVLTICVRNLGAVVSDSPIKNYRSLPKEETIKDLITHQFVIEKVMKDFTIVPVKFGTMLETKEDVVEFLDKGYFLLRNALRIMEGKIELNVVVSWKLPEVLASIYRRSSLIKKKQTEIAFQGNKTAIEDKIILGKLVEQALKNRKSRYQKLILQALKKEATEVCLHDLASEEIVFNAAFLVIKEHEKDFYQAVNLLDRKLEDSLIFRMVGPLPSYSFSTVVLEKLNSQEVGKAKKTLGLNGEITKESVREAYHQLAQKYHPDKNVGLDPLNFQLINSAYSVLKDFAEKGLLDVNIYRWEGKL